MAVWAVDKNCAKVDKGCELCISPTLCTKLSTEKWAFLGKNKIHNAQIVDKSVFRGKATEKPSSKLFQIFTNVHKLVDKSKKLWKS